MPRPHVAARPRALALAVAIAALACALGAPAGAAARVTLGNWDRAQQRAVVHAGLMHKVGSSFSGATPISSGQTDAAMAALAARAAGPGGSAPTVPGVSAPSAPAPVTAGSGAVTVVGFDRAVVAQLGLSDVAAHIQAVAVATGLQPPSYFGSETVARYLGLRFDHPAGADQLELFPTDPITRAEAAWSLAQVMAFGDWNVADARQTLSAFELPRMSANQLEALRIAVSRIGYPYVWGGTTDDTSDGLAHGGFDCSGFVWRVFKVSGLPWGSEIQGRTAAQQAGEIPRRQRLRASQLLPGDLLFFGSAHWGSRATEANVIHEGIYLGDNWVIHSSAQGVYVLPLTGGWLGDQFAWGRRVIH